MVKVIWTESALSDLNDIGEFIAKDSVRYAELTVAKLFESADILETHPKTGKKVPELNNNSFRELIRGSYRIIYCLRTMTAKSTPYLPCTVTNSLLKYQDSARCSRQVTQPAFIAGPICAIGKPRTRNKNSFQICSVINFRSF